MKQLKLLNVFISGILCSSLIGCLSNQPDSAVKLYYRPTQAVGSSMSLAGMPFVLKADGVEINKGVLDDGFVLVPHQLSTKQYEFEMANGTMFVTPVAQMSICQKNHFSRACLVKNGVLPSLEISKAEQKQEFEQQMKKTKPIN
jgi:hypothetical protein